MTMCHRCKNVVKPAKRHTRAKTAFKMRSRGPGGPKGGAKAEIFPPGVQHRGLPSDLRGFFSEPPEL